MYQTIVTWNPLAATEEIASIQAKSAEMTAAGKTDGVSQTDWPNGSGIAPQVVQRSWTTEADAQEWETFLNALALTPASVVIFTE
jgi:hypothetical protein